MLWNFHHELVVAFYWNTVKYAQLQQISTLKFLEVVRQHILGKVKVGG